jgi:uncharacterized short protein YbdD (DUF466 family)
MDKGILKFKKHNPKLKSMTKEEFEKLFKIDPKA